MLNLYKVEFTPLFCFFYLVMGIDIQQTAGCRMGKCDRTDRKRRCIWEEY